MTLSKNEHARLDKKMQSLKDAGEPFATATVVRTVNATSAKPGGKALLDAKGSILMGWVGGGCARSAVGKAAREAILVGAPQFISLRPQELLETEGVTPGEVREGVTYARNGCPSKGTMDVFVEPVLPLPRMVIFGTGLVALALMDLGERFDFDVRAGGPEGLDVNLAPVSGADLKNTDYIIVATQGQGDGKALRTAVSAKAHYVSFVGSAQKFAAVSRRLADESPVLAESLAQVHAPAGMDINAITPEEIALSILAEITKTRRAQDKDGTQAHD